MNEFLGHYGWWLLALALVGVEMIAPGYFMLWIGIAAAAMGVVTWLAPALPALAQAVLFALFGVASCLVYWWFIRPLAEQRDDQPLLNRRAAQAIGRVAVLEQAIDRGQGRIKLDDAVWVVEGPDLPAGTTVRVVAVDGMVLKVQEA